MEISEGILNLRADIQNIQSAVRQVLTLMDQVDEKSKQMAVQPVEILNPEKAKVDLSHVLITGVNELANSFTQDFVARVQQSFLKTQVSIPNILLTGKGEAPGTGGAVVNQENINRIDTEGNKQAFTRLANSVKEFNQELLKAKTLVDYKNALSALDKMSKQLGNTMFDLKQKHVTTSESYQTLQGAMASLSATQQKLNKGFVEQKSTLDLTRNAAKENIMTHEEFGKRLEIAIFKLIRYRVAFMAMRQSMLQLKDTITVFSEVNSALAQLNKVLDPIGTNLQELRDSAFDLGKKFAVSAIDVLKSMQVWAQMGLTQKDILKATEASLLTVNTTGLSAAEAVDALTSAIFTYGVAVGNITSVVDKWMAVQAKFPVEAQDLAKALFAAGSAAEEFGVSVDQLNGIIVAVNAVTRQSGKEIGNAFKTIFAKIPSHEGIKALNDVKIAVMDTKGNFRNLFTVLEDLSKIWDTLNASQKLNIAQIASGGTRQYVKFIALMNNFALAQDAVSTSMDSFGAASRANKIEVETFAKAMVSMTVELDRLKLAIGTNFAKPLSLFASALSAMLDSRAVGWFTNFISVLVSFGGTFLVIKAIIIALKFLMGRELVQSITKVITSLFVFGKQVEVVGFASARASVGVGVFSAAVKGLFTPLNIVLTAISLVVAGLTIFGRASEKFGATTLDQIRGQDEYIASLKNSIDAQKKQIVNIGELIQAREKLVDSIGKTNRGTEEYEKISQQLTDTEKEISTISGDMALVIAKNSTVMDGQKLTTIALKDELVKLKEIKEGLITAEENALKVNIVDFNNSYKASLASLTIKADQTTQAIDNIRTAIDEFKTSHITILDPNTTKILDDIRNAIDPLRESITPGGLNPDFSTLLVAKDKVHEVGKEIIKLKEQLGKLAFATPAAEPLKDMFKVMEDAISKASTDLGNIDTSKPEEFRNILENIFKTLTSSLGQQVSEIPLRLGQVKGAVAQEIANLKAQNEAIQNLFKTKPDDKGIISNFDEFFKRTLDQKGAVAELVAEYKNLQRSVLGLEDISKKSGGQLANYSLELAKANENFVKKAFSAQIDADKKITGLEAKRNELENKIRNASGVVSEDLDKYKTELKAINVGLKDEIDTRNAIIYLLGLEGVQGEQIAKQLNDAEKQRQLDLDAIIGKTETYKGMTQEIVNLMNSSAFSERQTLNFQKERLSGEVALVKEQLLSMDASEQEAFIKTKAKELTGEELEILKKIAAVDIVKSFQNIQTASKDFTKGLQEALGGIPEALAEGFDKRKELNSQLVEAEKELQKARAEGDNKSVASAQQKINDLKDQLKDYRAGWFEVYSIIKSITSSLSTSIFKSISDQLGDALANISINGEELQTTMGRAIAGEFDKSVKGLTEQLLTIDNLYLEKYKEIHDKFIADLREVFQIQGPPSPNNLTTQINGMGTVQGPPVEVNSDLLPNKMDRVLRLGSIYFGQIASRAIAGSGGRFASDLAGVLTSIGTVAFPDMAKKSLGPLLLGVGGGVAGLLIGTIGEAIFGHKKKDPVIPVIESNTAAIQGLTISMREFEKGIFGAPPNFILPAFSGANNQTGGANNTTQNISININGSNMNSQELASEIRQQIENSYVNSIRGQRVRGSIFA